MRLGLRLRANHWLRPLSRESPPTHLGHKECTGFHVPYRAAPHADTSGPLEPVVVLYRDTL